MIHHPVRAWHLCALSLAISLALYVWTLPRALIRDDLAILLYFHPALPHRWIDCFLPLGNGFLRPATILTFKTLNTLWGPTPLPYHAVSILIHASVAAITGLLARRLFPTPLPVLLATAVVAFHAGAFPSVYLLSNSCDTYFALGLVLGLLAWDKFLTTPANKRLAVFTLLAGVLCLLSKETGVVYPAVLILWWLARGKWSRKIALIWSAMVVISLGWLTAIYMLQRSTAGSYQDLGLVDLDITNALSRLTSYQVATVFPFLYTMGWPLPQVPLPAATLPAMQWMFALATALLVALAIWRTQWRLPAALWCAASCILLPVCILRMDCTPRFIYACLPFIALIIGWIFTGRALIKAQIALLTCIAILHLSTHISSPTIHEYYSRSRQWGNLVEAMRPLQPNWPPMSEIAIYTGEKTGSHWIPEPYGNAIFRVHYPNLPVNYISNRTTDNTHATYTFDGTTLKEVAK